MTAQSTDRNTFSVARITQPRPRRVGVRVGLGVIALLLATGGGLVGLQRLHDTGTTTATAAPPPPTVTVSAPLQRNVAAASTFTGQFSAVDHVEIRAQVSGYLTEIHFTDGQIVHQGDLLFVIDPRPYEIQLQQATAQQQTAMAQLDLANKQLARNTELRRSDVVSADVLDQRVQQQRAAQRRSSRPKPPFALPSSTSSSRASARRFPAASASIAPPSAT